jgi:4-amino-4-deoxy-L-arabinose transferase-like glycosyltransferase
MIIYMFLLVILFYLFVKKRYSFYSAILSVFLLISFSPFYGNGRPVQGEVPGLVFLVLGLWFLLFWQESLFENKKWALFSGLALGLSASTKPIYLILLSMVFVATLFFWFKKIKSKKILAIFSVGFILPILFWFVINFPSLNSVLKIIPTYLLLAGNHSSSVPLIQTFFHNLLRFFTESTPILFSFLFITIVLAYSFRFSKKENYNFSISEFWAILFIVLNCLAYLVGTGWYRYFFPANVLVYLFFPSAVLFLSNSVQKNIFRKAIFLIPIALIIFQSYYLIFLSDTSFVHNRVRNSELSAALSQIDPNQKVLFYNAPEAIIFLKGGNYSQYLSMENFLVA